jgi:hypothetical protein
MTTIHLATDDAMRAITSQNLHEISRLPTLYIPLRDFIPAETDPDAMKHWGVAHERTLADYVRLFPDALVAPCCFGDRASRADLIYHGAESTEAFSLGR